MACRTTSYSLRSGALLIAVLVAAIAPRQLEGGQQVRCDAARDVEQGWSAYQAGDIDGADVHFTAALRRCPRDAGALTGAGYVALRQNRLDVARARFSDAIEQHDENIDALLGRGIVAWREARLPDAHADFTQVLALDELNETALEYIAQMPAGLGTPPVRPPLQRPVQVQYPARALSAHFEIRTADGWTPFYINGVNLGAALPGRHPSEFPSREVYDKWIVQMAAMGVNTIRSYTIHPPAFYDALHAYNTAHPAAPLWLVHGVWAELPPHDDFSDAAWEREFFAEMHRVVDVLHGRADIAPRAGHASGFYTADVSPWVLAYIIGREWEPFAVVGYNRLRPRDTSFNGTYLVVDRGTPMDVWLAKACEEMIAYEMRMYNAQRPIAYTNWPTLDPLAHPTETTVAEEVAIRTALGEKVSVKPIEYDNDAAPLDAKLVRTTAALPAGYFASYHAYPYYPDFMMLSPEYLRATGPWGPSNYFGYLQALKRHHGDMPVLISEYGVPTSIGIAHMQPQGWHHGGLSEAQMAEVNAQMTREIAATGMAGGIVFAWIDEWFKKNWMTIEFEIPLERNRLWFNRLDAEQHYGMIAYDAHAPVDGSSLSERVRAWHEVQPMYSTDTGSLRVASDEAYLWLYFDATADLRADTLLIGFDVIDADRGERTWPALGAPASPTGLEFALRATRGSVELLVQSTYNPFHVTQAEVAATAPPAIPFTPANQPPGYFTGRVQQQFGRPLLPSVTSVGWQQMLVVPNRRRFSRDGMEFAALGYNRGLLREGNAPDGLWQWSADGRSLEVRIPWGLLNVTDPSQRRVLYEPAGGAAAVSVPAVEPGSSTEHQGQPAEQTHSEFGTTTIEGIRLVAAVSSGGRWHSLPGSAGAVAQYSWPTWETPRWKERIRPTYDAMRAAFAEATRISSTTNR